IPTLCYLKGLTPTGACGVCAVEVLKDDGTTEIKRLWRRT
ncbi:MAG: 2Fe-2S iron-sulfur cluster binding domain-containing protein, partial [Bacilli bacterium]|nr:2Fe-2S iron-sulfur cluster binding domain-containing protein [Bacilli bacterium]